MTERYCGPSSGPCRLSSVGSSPTEKYFEQLPVGNLRAVVFEPDRLGVARPARADGVVVGRPRVSACIAGRCFLTPFTCSNIASIPSEAAAGKHGRRLTFRHRHRLVHLGSGKVTGA